MLLSGQASQVGVPEAVGAAAPRLSSLWQLLGRMGWGHVSSAHTHTHRPRTILPSPPPFWGQLALALQFLLCQPPSPGSVPR